MINLKEQNESIGNQNLKDKFNNKIKGKMKYLNLLNNRKFGQSLFTYFNLFIHQILILNKCYQKLLSFQTQLIKYSLPISVNFFPNENLFDERKLFIDYGFENLLRTNE